MSMCVKGPEGHKGARGKALGTESRYFCQQEGATQAWELLSDQAASPPSPTRWL